MGGIKPTERQVIVINVLVRVHLAMLVCIHNVILWYYKVDLMLDAVLYIVESFYWKGIFADVKEFCKCCEVSTYKLTSTKASC